MALPFTLLSRGGFLIVDESGISRGDIHHSIAGPLFSCIGSFFSSFFPSSHLAMSSTSHPVPVVSPHPIQEVSSSPILVVSSHCPIPVVSSHCPISVVSSHSVQVASSCSNPVVSSCPKSKPSLEKRGAGSRIQRTFLGDQAHLPVQVIPQEKKKLQKNLLSIDQVSYAPASCNHSSLPSNRCGSSSYMSSHEPITVKVYTIQEKHHFPSKLDRGNPLPKLPQRQTSLANQMAHLHSLSTTE